MKNTHTHIYFQDVRRCEFVEFQVSTHILNHLLVGTCTMLPGMWVKMFLGGVLFFYKQMFFSTTLIGVIIFTFLDGEFWSNLSYLFQKLISVVSTILLYHVCVWWMVCGWMAWSGLLVLVVTCVSRFSLPGGGFILLLVIYFSL